MRNGDALMKEKYSVVTYTQEKMSHAAGQDLLDLSAQAERGDTF
jgi:hypothetical protein